MNYPVGQPGARRVERNKDRATQPKHNSVALLVACIAGLLLLAAGCDSATGSTGERIRLLITPVPTPTAIPEALPTSAPVKYTVNAGDSLYVIALTFGVTVDDIVRVNNIADPNSLAEGQVLTIPGRSEPPTPTSTPGPDAAATPVPPPPASPTLPAPDATPPQGPDVPEVPGGDPQSVPSATADPGLDRTEEAPGQPTAAP
jgi:LysM repeat protein